MHESPNPFTQKELPVLLTVDVCDGSFDREERKGRVTELMGLLPKIKDLIGEVISERFSALLPVTWFVRADMQVKELTGNTLGLYRGWKDFWESVRAAGGEVAWHPHLYKRRGRQWIPIRDPKRLSSAAEKIWHEISESEWNPVTSRMGESVGSSELMRFLSSIDIIADASALPGRVRDDGLRWFDWLDTPDTPYHPAFGEYSRPSIAHGESDRAAEEEPLSILEIPFTMAPIRAPYDSPSAGTSDIRRYIDLSFDPELLKNGIGHQLKTAEYVVFVVHPMQASGREIPDGGLVVGGFDTLAANLNMILDRIAAHNRVPRLMTVEEFANLRMGILDDEKDESEDTAVPVEREERDKKKKGGTQRTLVEKKKSARLTTKGGIRAEKKRPRPGPRKRRG